MHLAPGNWVIASNTNYTSLLSSYDRPKQKTYIHSVSNIRWKAATAEAEAEWRRIYFFAISDFSTEMTLAMCEWSYGSVFVHFYHVCCIWRKWCFIFSYVVFFCGFSCHRIWAGWLVASRLGVTLTCWENIITKHVSQMSV